MLRRTDDYAGYNRPLYGIAPTLKLSVGPVSVNTAPIEIGGGFQFGKLGAASLKATEVDPVTHEVKACMRWIRAIDACAGWRTTYTPDGVSSGPTGSLSIFGQPLIGDQDAPKKAQTAPNVSPDIRVTLPKKDLPQP
jgi:hypothetical protein